MYFRCVDERNVVFWIIIITFDSLSFFCQKNLSVPLQFDTWIIRFSVIIFLSSSCHSNFISFCVAFLFLLFSFHFIYFFLLCPLPRFYFRLFSFLSFLPPLFLFFFPFLILLIRSYFPLIHLLLFVLLSYVFIIPLFFLFSTSSFSLTTFS